MPAPALDTRTVKAILTDELPHLGSARLVLVHGTYPAGEKTSMQVDGRIAQVTEQQSVLGMLDAWLAHRDRPGDDVLVVVHPFDDEQLSWDLRGHAVRRRTLTVDLATIVQRRFGAAELDPRVRANRWLVDGLIDAEPTAGWRRSGPVLAFDMAARALVTARLGDVSDSGALLQWSQGTGPARFRTLPDAERAGLASWLTANVGGVAGLLMALVEDGRAADALSIGVIAAVLDDPGVPREVMLAVGGLLGSARSGPVERRAFVEAVEGILERWVSTAENGGLDGADARSRVLAVVHRADQLAAEAGLTPALQDSVFLPSSFRARLCAVAATLSANPDATIVTSAGTTLEALREHRLARLHPERCAAAAMAVRLVRWLAEPAPGIASVGGGVATQVADGGWVDRALTAVWAGESVDDPVVSRAYRAVYEAAQQRRSAQDATFAARLADWTRHASAQVSGGVLVIEKVLDEIAVPLLAVGPPLVLVVDGMSAAVAAELGEQLGERGWAEATREAGRRAAAVATVPSVTLASRSSLLSGRAAVGDQADERAGFTAFWKRHRRGALLVHKADIPGPAGRRLAESLVEALADERVVVGVVLNTVDDALDHGREGDRSGWRLADITYLLDLLDAARSYARPVVLVADHGHVLDRGGSDGPAAVTGVESARWRTGEPQDGEIALTGPRVLLGGGHVVVPWREEIRYTRRRAGYHGGASLAEMAVPVLVFTPTPEQLPLGWSLLPIESVEPAWWNGRRVVAPSAPTTRTVRRSAKRAVVPESDGLFAAPEPIEAAQTLGQQVVASTVYALQAARVPRPPDKAAVATVIDALAVEGRLSATATAAALGKAGRDPGRIVETLRRLLNVEQFDVIRASADTVELNVDLLRLQFPIAP